MKIHKKAIQELLRRTTKSSTLSRCSSWEGCWLRTGINNARGGISVYWIVNLIDRPVEVYTGPNLDCYSSCVIYKSGQLVPVAIDGVEVGQVAVAEILPRISQAAGAQWALTGRVTNHIHRSWATRQPPNIPGKSSPRSLAHSRASGYPASAWRMTPVAGSFHSTRSSRFAAAGVPSATITMPACCE